jgi:hypothetical protein
VSFDEAVLKRFSKVFGRDRLDSSKVGDRARDADDAMERSR